MDHFFSLPDGLRHLFGDHNPSSILICCVIYDLEGSNDAYPQDANLTLAGEIYLLLLSFICSYRNKNEPVAIYPSFGYSPTRKRKEAHVMMLPPLP